MVCHNCGTELKDTDVFCKVCGTKCRNVCSCCGMSVKDKAKFCSHCGKPIEKEEFTVLKEKELVDSKEAVLLRNISENIDEDFDRYRDMLLEKSKKEKIMLGGVVAASLIAIFVYYGNNGNFAEALITGTLIGGIGYILYGLVAGNLEVFEATKYLKKYDSIKENVGKKEAILFIENDYKPSEKGLGPMLASAKMTGGCFGGCLQMVLGLATSIIAIIMTMAFC